MSGVMGMDYDTTIPMKNLEQSRSSRQFKKIKLKETQAERDSITDNSSIYHVEKSPMNTVIPEEQSINMTNRQIYHSSHRQ